MKEQTQEWIFTFGFGHEFQNCYTVITGTEASTRDEMFQRYGSKWSMQYASREAAGVNRFHLTEV